RPARLRRNLGVRAPAALDRGVRTGGLGRGGGAVLRGRGRDRRQRLPRRLPGRPRRRQHTDRFRGQLVAFHEGLAFIAQVVMFVVLGLLVFPHELGSVALSGLALGALLVLLIRPIAVWISTALSRFTTRERLPLGWAGLRGAVPIVLGTIVLSSHVDNGKTIFNAVFFVVVVSALVQGWSLEWVAERLQVVSVGPRDHAPPLEVGALSSLDLIEFDVAAEHAIAGSAVRELSGASPDLKTSSAMNCCPFPLG